VSRSLELRLRKVEAKVGRPDDVSRLSDEELEAELNQLLPMVVATLACGDESEQQLGRALAGKHSRDLTRGERDQLLARVQARR
jgi:hypothetical protein